MFEWNFNIGPTNEATQDHSSSEQKEVIRERGSCKGEEIKQDHSAPKQQKVKNEPFSIESKAVFTKLTDLCKEADGSDFQYETRVSEEKYLTSYEISNKEGVITGKGNFAGIITYHLEETSCDQVLAGEVPSLIYQGAHYTSW